MVDTNISNAVVFPEDRGTGLGGGDSDYSSAGHFGLLSQHQGGTYVGNGLGFTNVDTTNETVDITTGHAFIEVSSVTVQSGSGETYDTTLPDPIVMTIALPSTVTLSLDTDAVNDVYLATDPATNDGAYLRHGSSVSTPTDPSVKLGTVNTSDGSTTRVSDNASPTFDTVTSETSNTGELTGNVADGNSVTSLFGQGLEYASNTIQVLSSIWDGTNIVADVDNQSVNTERASITDQTSVRVQKGSDQTLTAGTKEIVNYTSIQRDNLGEWSDANNEFSPQETGEYLIIITTRITDHSQGDTVTVYFQDSSSNIFRSTESIPTTGAHNIKTMGKQQLQSGESYSVAVNNFSSDCTLQGVKTEFKLNIWRVPE
jgi:hypothetical protein